MSKTFEIHKDKVDKKVIEKEITRLKMALDLMS